MGKGGSITIGYRYSFDIHMGLGLPIDEVPEIRVGGKTAWAATPGEQLTPSSRSVYIDAPALFGGDDGEGGIQGDFTVMFGEENQTAIPTGPLLGPDTPKFRGFSSAFYSGLVTSMNPYPKPWEFMLRGGERLWGDQPAWYPEKQFIWLANGNIRAMNPVHILYQTLTSSLLRRNPWPAAWLDDAAWRAAADTCYAENLGLCLRWSRSDKLSTFRDVVTAHMGAELFDDRTTGLYSITLLRDDYDPESLPLFDEDSGLLEIVEDETPSTDRVPSELVVKYVDASDGETKTVRAVNSAVAARDAGGSVETVEYLGAPTGDIAARLAERDLRIRSSGLKRFKVILDRRARDLHLGQPFRIRSTRRGIEQIVVRSGRIEDGTLLDGRITITALQDVFGLPANSFVAIPPVGWAPPDRTPQSALISQAFEVSYRDLALALPPLELDLLTPDESLVGAVAAPPTGLHLAYGMHTSVDGGAWQKHGTGDWPPLGEVEAAVPQEVQSTLQLINHRNLQDLVIGQAAFLGTETVRVVGFNASTGEVTIDRGCVDTTPVEHPAGTRFWGYERYAAADPNSYSAGANIDVRLTPRTSSGELALDQAPIIALVIAGRQGRPYPPGDARLNGESYPDAISGALTVSWSHRDRLLQHDQVIATSAGNIGPEPGTTYTVRVFGEAGTLIRTESGLTGTSWSYPLEEEAADSDLEPIVHPGGDPETLALEDASAPGDYAVSQYDTVSQTSWGLGVGTGRYHGLEVVGVFDGEFVAIVTSEHGGPGSATARHSIVTASDGKSWQHKSWFYPASVRDRENWVFLADRAYHYMDGGWRVSSDLVSWVDMTLPTDEADARVLQVGADGSDFFVIEVVSPEPEEFRVRRWLHDGVSWSLDGLSDPLTGPYGYQHDWGDLPSAAQPGAPFQAHQHGGVWFVRLQETTQGDDNGHADPNSTGYEAPPGPWKTYWTTDWVAFHRTPINEDYDVYFSHWTPFQGEFWIRQSPWNPLSEESITLWRFTGADFEVDDWPLLNTQGTREFFTYIDAGSWVYWTEGPGSGKSVYRTSDFINYEDVTGDTLWGYGVGHGFREFTQLDNLIITHTYAVLEAQPPIYLITGDPSAPGSTVEDVPIDAPSAILGNDGLAVSDPAGIIQDPRSEGGQPFHAFLRNALLGPAVMIPWGLMGRKTSESDSVATEVTYHGEFLWETEAVLEGALRVGLVFDTLFGRRALRIDVDIESGRFDVGGLGIVETESLALSPGYYHLSFRGYDAITRTVDSDITLWFSCECVIKDAAGNEVFTFTKEMPREEPGTTNVYFTGFEYQVDSLILGWTTLKPGDELISSVITLDEGDIELGRLNDSLRVEIFSVRDGLESWQRHDIEVVRDN